MSEPLSKTDLVRAAWITALRREGHRQCRDHYKVGGRRCAMGLLADIAGVDPRLMELRQIGRLAGLGHMESHAVAALNDGSSGWRRGPLTFSQIADVIEQWYRK